LSNGIHRPKILPSITYTSHKFLLIFLVIFGLGDHLRSKIRCIRPINTFSALQNFDVYQSNYNIMFSFRVQNVNIDIICMKLFCSCWSKNNVRYLYWHADNHMVEVCSQSNHINVTSLLKTVYTDIIYIYFCWVILWEHRPVENFPIQ